MSVNPYQPPLLPPDNEPADEPPVAWPATGAYRYYQTLVWNTATPLPRVCVQSGLPADSSMTVTLRPLIDDDGSILASDKAKSRQYEVSLPISTAGHKLYDWRQLGWLCALLGLMCAALAAYWPGPFRRLDPLYNIMPAVTLGMFALLLLAVGLRWLAQPMRIQLLCVDRTYLQLFGLHPSFLSSLPEWPVPDRDSVRR